MIFIQTIDPAQKTHEVARQLVSGNANFSAQMIMILRFLLYLHRQHYNL